MKQTKEGCNINTTMEHEKLLVNDKSTASCQTLCILSIRSNVTNNNNQLIKKANKFSETIISISFNLISLSILCIFVLFSFCFDVFSNCLNVSLNLVVVPPV